MTRHLVLVGVLLAVLAAEARPEHAAEQQVAVNADSCSSVKGYFTMRNLSAIIPDIPLSGAHLQVCRSGRSCCTTDMEADLQKQVHRDFTALMQHNSKSTQGLLESTANSLQGHLVRLARWSEGKTLNLFGQVYKRMAVLARGPIHQLYADIIRYLDTPAAGAAGTDEWLSSPPLGPSMSDSVTRFFAKLFPLTFHTTIAPVKKAGSMVQRQLEPEYERCLASKMSEVQPFGDSPRALAHSLGRALEAARVLLGVLRVGADTLNSTNSLLIDTEQDHSVSPSCSSLLLRMWSCSRCSGLSARPCQGYCLNVLRGCVTSRASELDQPWASFMEAAAKLAGSAAAAPQFPGRPRSPAKAAQYQLNAEEAIRQMENKISEAIMYAMENGPAVERKMKSACGPPKWQEGEGTTPAPRRAVAVDSLLDSSGSSASAVHFAITLRELQDSLTRSRSFYADLADVLCADEGFAADNQPCWNGQRVGEYTKTVVAASASAQRYNPELPWTARGTDPRIAHLGDKLRHLRQLVLSQLSQLSPESDSFVRDEEGSGSGHDVETQWTDDEDRSHVPWSEQGSGSGAGDPVDMDHNSNVNTWPPEVPSKKPEAGADKTSAVQRIHGRQLSVVLWATVLVLLRAAGQ